METKRMQLYVLPGACSLASHIALETATERAHAAMPPWEVIVLQRGRNHDPEYTAVNPLGTVPALITASGGLILESLAVLLHIADAVPEAQLAAPTGEPDRDRVHMLLSLMATGGHTAFQMLWRSERFADTEEGRAAVRRMCEFRIGALFARLQGEIRQAGYLVGHQPTVADMYLYVLGRWGLRLERPTTSYPALWNFIERMAASDPVHRAMIREGIALHGPKTGLG
jgi:glutathione S-transferase